MNSKGAVLEETTEHFVTNEDEAELEVEEYEAGGGKMSYHGITYQLRLLMFFLLRGLINSYSFALATDIKDADKFDDVVFRYKSESTGGYVYRLLQSKHRAGKQSAKITIAAFLSDNEKGDFNLKKYFKSYLKLKPKFSGKGKEIRDVIMCTNGELKENELCDGVRLKDMFENRKNNTGEEVVDEIFQTKLLSLKKSFIGRDRWVNNLKTCVVDGQEKEVESFLDVLVFAMKQPNTEELKELIIKELVKKYKVSDSETVFSLFQQKMYDWMTKFEGSYFSVHEGEKFMRYISNKFGRFSFALSEPVSNFKGRKSELEKLEEAVKNGEKIIGITGLGGFGKSELARKYIHDHSDRFRRVVWLNADSPESLVRSFQRLAVERLNIDIHTVDGKEKQIESVLEEVYTFFDSGDSVIIFDNVEELNEEDEVDHIKEFLPNASKKPLILLTSKYELWDDVYLLPIGEILEDDAMDLVKSSLDIVDDSIDESVKTLTRKLQCFPLALQQAIAYIRLQDSMSESFGETFGIDGYLKAFDKEAKKLLNFKFSSFRKDVYVKTTLTTWSITLQKIKKHEHGNLAYSVLKLISHFSPDDIDRMDLMKYFPEKEQEDMKKSLWLLKEYSIISFKSGMISIHRLVQHVIRLTLKDEGEDVKTLKWALKLSNEIKVEHVMSLWDLLQNYPDLRAEYSHLPEHIIHLLDGFFRYEEGFIFGRKYLSVFRDICSPYEEKLLSAISSFAGVAKHHGMYKDAISLYEELYEKQKKIYSEDNSLTLDTKYKIASTLNKLGEYEKALTAYEEIYEKRKDILGVDHESTLLARHSMASVMRNIGRYSQALSIFEEVYEKKKNILGLDHQATLSTLNKLALVHANLGDYKKALCIFEQVFEKRSNVFVDNHPKMLKLRRYIADSHESLGLYDKALSIYEDVFLKERETLGEDHPNTLLTRNNIAYVYDRLTEYNKALAIYQEVYEREKNTLGEDHPSSLNTRRNIGDTLESLGKYNEALSVYERVYEKEKQVLGEDHPGTLATMVNIGLVYTRLGKYDKALQMYEKVYEKEKLTIHEDDPSILTTLNNIGFALNMSGQYKKAVSVYEIVYRKRIKVLGYDHPSTLTAGSNYACALKQLGKYEMSLCISQDIYKICQQKLGVENYRTLIVRYHIGHNLLNTCKYKEALSIFEELFLMYKDKLGEDHPETSDVRRCIAKIFHKLGRYDKAMCIYEEVYNFQKKCLGEFHIKTLETRSLVASAFVGFGRYSEALLIYEEIYKEMLNSVGEGNPLTLDIRNNIAREIVRVGHLKKGLSIYNEVLAMQKEFLGDDHPSTLETKCEIGYIHASSGNFEDALCIYKDVYETQKDSLGEEHMMTLNTRSKMSSVLGDLGDSDNALSICKQIYQKVCNLVGTDHPKALEFHLEVANALKNAQFYESALLIYEEVHEKSIDILGDNNPLSLWTKFGIASVMFYQGEYLQALSIFQDLYKMEKKSLGSLHPYSLRIRHEIAVVLSNLNECDEALEIYDEVYQMRSSVLGENHPDTIQTRQCQLSLSDKKQQMKHCQVM